MAKVQAPRTAANSSVDQVFGVLELAAAGDEPVGVAEVARALGIPTSTAHRVLNTLVATGYLARDVSGARYELGVIARELAEAFFARFPLRDVGASQLRRLVTLTGETTTLSVRLGWYDLRVAGLAGWHEIAAAPAVGRARALDRTLTGQILLAGLEDAEVEAFLRWRARRLGRLEPAPVALRRQVARLRPRAVVQRSARGAETSAAVLAIRDAQGRTCAAFTIEGAADHLDGTLGPMLPQCRAIVDELELMAVVRPRLLTEAHGHIPRDEIDIPVMHLAER